MAGSWYKRLVRPEEKDDQLLNLPERYSSDDELNTQERDTIQYSSDPQATREMIWSKKPTWNRVQRWMKTRLHGDKATGE